MRAVVVGVVLLAGIGSAMAEESSPKDLVFVGTVKRIFPAETGDPIRAWVVETAVKKVVSGSFSHPTFTFAIHSPAMANMKVGGSYEITARWTGTGYLVDELNIHESTKRR